MSVTDKALKVVAERPPSVPAPLPPALFSPDRPVADPASPRAAFLAELALHDRVATPLCIGLFGAPGTGKTSLLHATLETASRLSAAADDAGIATPFVADTLIVPVTLKPGADPAASILNAMRNALADKFPTLAKEAAQAQEDPHAMAEAARDRLDQLRHRLDGERRRLDELTARQARLTETILFEPSGSQVDAYARAHRGRIERRLRRFGFDGDPLTTYKELVRDADEGGQSRGLGWLPALWAYRGQKRLLVAAIAFFVLFWGLGLLIDHQDAILDTLRTSNERLAPLADGLAAHAAWLAFIRQVAGLAGCAALAINLARAFRFHQPIVRGARLLRGDLDARRRDLDGLVAHQAKRVETLASEVEAAGRLSGEAEDRLARQRSATDPLGNDRRVISPSHGGVEAFFSALSATMSRQKDRRGERESPARLLVALDGFDRLTSRDAAAALERAHDLLAHPGIVTVAALDRTHIANGLSETDPALATASLDRIVQVPIAAAAETSGRELVQTLLWPAPLRGEAAEPAEAPDAARSELDKPWLPREAAVLEALASFAGETPRALKRFVNLYRVARADPAMQSATAADHAVLALGLALQARGLTSESVGGSGPSDDDLPSARHAAATALGTAIDLNSQSRGLVAARRYASV